ncbi:MAG: S-formylglutathione hydrolase [Polyangiaceae bacterium]
MSLEVVSQTRVFGGKQGVYRHASKCTGTTMEFSVFVPDAVVGTKAPSLTYLSGLTCTWENVTTKGGGQRYAAEHGLVVVCPDTSPRGIELPGDRASWDFGVSAGFYVDATEAPWSGHYRMFSYVTDELPRLVAEHFPVDPARRGITGHSMGGHGALVAALRRPDVYRTVSALAPIASATRCPWGEKALGGYLGPDRGSWKDYDASLLLAKTKHAHPILIDQGKADKFLFTELQPEFLVQAAKASGSSLELRMHDDYDHSYYFVATFLGDHVAHHARVLA